MAKINLSRVVFGIIVLGYVLMPQVVTAEAEKGTSEYEQLPPGIAEKEIPGRGLHWGWIKGRHLGWDKENWLKLKAQDPQRFKQLLGEREEEIKARLKKLKEKDPQRYQKLIQRIQYRRKMQMHKLREENPEEFKEILKEKRVRWQKRLEELKAKDPKRYNKILQELKMRREFRRLKKEDPQKAKEFLQQQPSLKERMKQRHEHSPEIGQRRQGECGRPENNWDRKYGWPKARNSFGGQRKR